MQDYITQFKDLLIEYAPSVISALVLLIVGLFAISFLTSAVRKLMKKRGVDQTLQGFVGDLINWTLKILLFVTVISQLGVATTSFAAIIAAAGLAIGLALQGSLSNFAGGALIMIFRPFKAGDFIEAQGVSGTVKEIQMFTTHINTPNNRLAIVPNGELSNGNIINYSAEDKVRVNLTFGVSYDADIKETKEVLMSVITSNEKTLEDPAPSVNVAELADSSVNFSVKTWVHTPDYWDVHFQVIEDTKIALDKAGIDIPYPHQVEIQKEG